MTEIDCNVCLITMAVVAGQDEGLVEKRRGERGLSGRQGEACQSFSYGAPPTHESLLFSSHPPPPAVVFSVCGWK